MPELIVPNAAQMRLVWALSGQLYALNVLGVVNTGAVVINQALTNAVAADIKAAFTSSAHADDISTTITLASIGLRDIRSAAQPEFIDTGGAVAGTMALELLPPQTALCVTLRTALAGASYRGRVYLPGFAEGSNTTGGVAVGAVLAPAVAFVAAIQDALAEVGLDLGVLSRPNDDVVPAKPGWITPVTSIVVRDAVWDTQRRRAVPGI